LTLRLAPITVLASSAAPIRLEEAHDDSNLPQLRDTLDTAVSQRAALYTVRVRSRRGGVRPLADLLAVLAGALDGFVEASGDGTTFVRAVRTQVEGDELFVVLQHGESGVAADIVDRAGGVRLHQRADDAQLVRCGCLFHLPAAATEGKLAVHVNDGRGVKELLESGLRRRFAARSPQLALELVRHVDQGLLLQAVTADRVERVKLVRIERSGDRTIAAVDKWVSSGPARVELDVAGHIRSELIRRYLRGEHGAFADIVEFGGITFQEAKVEVRLPDDTRRLFDLAHPEQGRPMTRDLSGLEFDDDGQPLEESLRLELAAALT
jgi:hypothetical protein